MHSKYRQKDRAILYKVELQDSFRWRYHAATVGCSTHLTVQTPCHETSCQAELQSPPWFWPCQLLCFSSQQVRNTTPWASTDEHDQETSATKVDTLMSNCCNTSRSQLCPPEMVLRQPHEGSKASSDQFLIPREVEQPASSYSPNMQQHKNQNLTMLTDEEESEFHKCQAVGWSSCGKMHQCPALCHLVSEWHGVSWLKLEAVFCLDLSTSVSSDMCLSQRTGSKSHVFEAT